MENVESLYVVYPPEEYLYYHDIWLNKDAVAMLVVDSTLPWA